MKATLRGTELYFDITGMQLAPTAKGFVENPVLFLLHGGPGGDHTRYKQHSSELQEAAQLVFIDHRGSGRSKRTKKADYTLENNIEDIEALRKHLGLERICLLGTSYGGIVAQGYAIRYPKRVEKLVLVATAPSHRVDIEAKAYVKQHGNAKQQAICEHLWAGTFKNLAHLQHYFELMDPLYSTTARKTKKATFAKSQTMWSVDAINHGFSTFLRKFDYIPHLKKITCPTLVLAGEEDWICRPSQSKLIAKHIKNARLKIYKNCAHAVAVDAHKQYIKDIKGFLKKRSP